MGSFNWRKITQQLRPSGPPGSVEGDAPAQEGRRSRRALWSIPVLLGLMAAVTLLWPVQEPVATASAPGDYVVLAWNDLGMHCYNPSFQDLAVLPPYNTLWAQVIHVGDPPQIVTDGIRVEYFFADNTYSVGKTDFWEYEQDLFGVDLPPNVGLTGKGLSGEMDPAGDHFVAEGIPLTEYSDSAPTTRAPYQLATVIVYDVATGQELARTQPVAPVSTEMHCDNCHYDGGVEGIATGRVDTNILTLHDEENSDEYPPGHEGLLMDRRPILCAECHASNALGEPGQPGVPSLSKAIHKKHKKKVPDSLEGCYNCHPGPQTQCLRDVMSTQHGMQCTDCHGGMKQVGDNPNPWLQEPRCDNGACHGSDYAQDQALFRLSKGHGGVYCAACHDSPHAIAPSNQANDAIKFIAMQGHNGPLDICTVCHATQPTEPGPHGIVVTPVATASPTATDTPSPEDTPTPVQTSTPTETPSITETPGITETPSPTGTPGETETPEPTHTPQPTGTPEAPLHIYLPSVMR